MKKSILFAIMILFTLSLAGMAFAEDFDCGQNLSCTLSNDGVFTVSGSGPMADFQYSSDIPWKDSRKNIVSVVIEEGVTSVGKNAFYWCQNLTNVQLPESLTTIGDYAFQSDSKLTDINIPDSVMTIGKGAFESDSGLTGIHIPDGLTTISERAFNGCSGLTSITIPEGITYIGDSAFRSCRSITSIDIPAGVTYLSPENVFTGCTKLTAINIAEENKNYVSVDGVVFDNAMTQLLYYPSGKTSASYEIPDGITGINKYAFSYNGSLINVTIPSSVTSIGENAFYEASKLVSVSFSEGLVSIGDDAFQECSSLTSVTLPASLISLGDQVFAECTSLTAIDVAEGSANYVSPDGVLFNKSMTTLIAYPAGMTRSSYTVPDGVEKIGDYAFYYCKKLVSVKFPDSLVTIGHSAFYGADGLADITFPESLVSIEDYAFDDCDGLTAVTLPASVSVLGSSAFNWCKNLTSVTVLNPSLAYPSWGCFSYGSKSLVLKGYAGSTTEAYAKSEEFGFEEITAEPEPEPEQGSGDVSAAEPADPWTCDACGHEMDGGKYCSECGHPRHTGQICTGCGYEVPEGQTFMFCPVCGTKFEQVTAFEVDLTGMSAEDLWTLETLIEAELKTRY